MATLTVQAAQGRAGQDITANAVAAAGGGDKFLNGPNVFLAVINGDVASKTVTFAIQKAVDGVTPAGKTVTVPANHTMLIGPFDAGIYTDSLGYVDITYSAVTSVTVVPFAFI